MKNDMLMAKTDEPGVINLAVGEPGCLQDTFGVYGFYGDGEMPRQAYPPLAGTHTLLQELRLLHPGDDGIVVATGAKQALLAAIYAYRQILSPKDNPLPLTVIHRRPYWPSHKTLAELAGCRFATQGGDIRINTSPNNPDGSIDHGPCDIWDAAYAHQMYGFRVEDTPPHETAVYSAAKLLGMSGDRVGWLVTGDPKIARIAAAYIESTTSGVSIYSQQRVAHTLRRLRENPASAAEAYRGVEARLRENMVALESALDMPIQGKGMFAWVKLTDLMVRHFAEAKVRYLPGEACGMPGRARINLGASDYLFDAAMQRLRKTQRHGDDR